MKKIIRSIFYIYIIILVSLTPFKAESEEIMSKGEERKIIVLENPSFKGDQDQILAVADQIVAKDSTFSLTRMDISHQTYSPRTRDIVISSGSYGLQALVMAKKQDHTIFTLWVSHQLLENLPSYAKHIDMITFPEGAGTKEEIAQLREQGANIVETFGVSQRMTINEVNTAFSTFSHELPKAQKYLLVVLGGDVQGKNGTEWYVYTEQEALKLAHYVEKLARKKKLYILVTNGPRTGKFNPLDRQERTFVHRGGQSDPVTTAFMQEITKRNKKVHLFDFQYGAERKQLLLLLGAIRNKKGSYALLPGESVSLLSQGINVLPPEKIIVFQHSAMRDVHFRQVEFLSLRHLIRVVNDKGTLSLLPPMKSSSPPPPSAQLIASKILEMYALSP